MNLPTIFDWLETFAFLRGYPATWIVLITAVLVTLFLDWRLSLLALIIQYLTVSLLFFDLLNPQLALIKLFTGMFVCLILYWTARQLTYGRPDAAIGYLSSPHRGDKLCIGSLSVRRDLALRLAAVAAAILLSLVLQFGLSFRFPGLPDVLDYISLAILLLLSIGAAGLVTSRDPLGTGMCVLTFLSGFELYFAALDQSTLLLAMLSALNLLVALAASYLAQRRSGLRAVLREE